MQQRQKVVSYLRLGLSRKVMKASQDGNQLKQIDLSQNNPCSVPKCHKRLAFSGNTGEVTDKTR